MRVVLFVVLVLFFAVPCGCLAAVVWAQAPAATAPASPVLDAGDKILISTLLALIESANADCQALDSVKKYQTHKAQADQFFAGKYKGYALNWATQRLEAPKPAPSK